MSTIQHNLFWLDKVAKLGLTITHARAVLILRIGQKVTMGNLAQELTMTTAAMTGTVDTLEKMGFVERQRGKRDRRVQYLELTERALQEFPW